MSLLFGPKVNQVGVVAEIRPMLFDIEVVAEVCAVLKRHLADADARHIAAHAGPSPSTPLPSTAEPITVELSARTPEERTEIVPMNEVVKLSRMARKRLAVTGGGARIDFRADQAPVVYVNAGVGFDAAEAAELTTELTQLLIREGRARPQWRRWALGLPIFLFVVIVAAWVWVCVAETPPLPLLVFGTLITASVGVGSVAMSRWQRRRVHRSGTGHRFRESSREKLRDALAQWKVNGLVALIGAIIGAIGTYYATIGAS
ncbi:hypothetical protein [Curtobacterium sp. ISL-83]|uniref:hypothetical protein n=1 Tax=Curtobacterium sp. ISL-83 TaxID=2819145 RepID=UPI001BEC8D95|nr:hypothetical protein [Curtobacterium sp. ISL-83]MBT2501426.1 hypothetical protein [Curtobacterium sp. ISL-83]